MEFPELSLSLSSNSAELSDHHQEIRLPMKRKIQGSVDLHQPWKEPLPLDWEQCLDLQSGRMYYVNRKTMKKTWEWPKKADQEQKSHHHHHHHHHHQLNLDLNISTSAAANDHHRPPSPPPSHGGGGEEMMALPCSNCHLLVIVSQSSPSCPNCKFVQYSSTVGGGGGGVGRSPAKPFLSGRLSLFN